MIFYAYYMWIGYYGAKFLRFWLNPLDQLLPFYYVAGFISFALALIITYKAVNTHIPQLAKTTLLGSLTVFSCSLIFDSHHMLIWYYLAKFYGFRILAWYRYLPLYYLTGLTSFALALIFIYKALKTKIHKLSIGLTSAILIITGSFLIYDAYQISLEYHYGPRKLYHYFAGLQAAYQWLPLYITVALISLGSGLIIAYKTLKTLKTQPPSIQSRIRNILLPDRDS